MADHLPTELLSTIGLKLDCTGDRIRFRAVSKSWRSALPFRQPPWLMLSQSQHEEDEEEEEGVVVQPRGFVSVGDQSIPKFHFPEIHLARVVGSAGNWLITVHLDKTIRVTNPFSRAQFHLPSHFPVGFVPFRNRGEHGGLFTGDELTPKWYRDDFIFKLVPSWTQPNISDVYCVAIVYHFYDSVLAIARPGDSSWTLPRLNDPPDSYPGVGQKVEDVIFYDGDVYAVNYLGHLIFCDVGDGVNNRPQAWLFKKYSTEGYTYAVPGARSRRHYLVEWLGELLKVVRYIMTDDDDHDSYRTLTFKIYKVVDFANPDLVELESLGDHSLFLGYNTSVSLLASDYFGLVRRNCIYFTDDRRVVERNNKFIGDERGRDMGVFDLESNTIVPHFEGISTSRLSPPVWIVPQYPM